MLILFMLISTAFDVSAEEIKKINVYGEKIIEIDNAILSEGTTMVPIRTLSEALGMELIWFQNTHSIVLWNDEVEIRAKLDEKEAEVNLQKIELSHPPVLVDNLTYLPLRNFSEAISAEVVWDSETGATNVFMKGYTKSDEMAEETDLDVNQNENLCEHLSDDFEKIFYSQRNSEWGFENNGNGYCWTTVYAMAITEVLKTSVTPDMIAEINLKKGSGAFTQHGDIIAEYGVRFVPAIDESSIYFDRFEEWRGSTYIKAEDDAAAIAAIKEALDKNPQGVMVRYTIYPHTLYAVGYENDVIYFHEPAYEESSAVTFEETCLKQYKISDLDFMQAIKE